MKSSNFKSIDDYSDLNDPLNFNIVGDLFLQTSTFNIPKQIDDCDEYYGFLGQLKKLHDKVDSGDLSDFSELKSCKKFYKEGDLK